MVGLMCLFAVSACGPAKKQCDATTCSSGCCDADGECQGGFEAAACGVGRRVYGVRRG